MPLKNIPKDWNKHLSEEQLSEEVTVIKNDEITKIKRGALKLFELQGYIIYKDE